MNLINMDEFSNKHQLHNQIDCNKEELAAHHIVLDGISANQRFVFIILV